MAKLKKNPAKLGSEVGYKKPPKANQFGQPNANPRSNGSWKKEDTPRYKLEQMMKMSDAELLAVYADLEAPLFERKLAQAISKGDWKVIREITHEVYGTPKQSVDMTTNGQSIAPPIVRIIDERIKRD